MRRIGLYYGKTKNQLALFLLSRGLWLILLEATVITLGLTFDLQFRLFVLQVIWAIGISMVVLAGLVYLPRTLILLIAVIILAGHNVLNGVSFPDQSGQAMAWSALHTFGFFRLTNHTNLLLLYPMLPWLGILLFGYYMGALYTGGFDARRRRNILLLTGGIFIGLFLALRLLHPYGDPVPFTPGATALETLYNLLRTQKYPPSLHFTLMTLGPALMLLAFAENWRGKLAQWLITFGRVPFFYYLLHIYLIHGLAILTALVTGFTLDDFGPAGVANMPKGYGISLGGVYLMWLLVVVLLYPLCHWFAHYKTRNKQKIWLSYI
jgi:uncharacterized membrane protein